MANSKFINFQDIDINNESTWNGKIVLSIDIDWASDEQIEKTIGLIDESIKITIFATHRSDYVEELVFKRQNVEIGLHPNFDNLISGKDNSKGPEEILEDLLCIIPEAQVLRSHGMTTSGRWLKMYKNYGIKYISNYLMYGVSNVRPFYQINGLVEAPVYFADDGYMNLQKNMEIENIKMDDLLSKDFEGIKVMNFHPVHVATSIDKMKKFGFEGTKSDETNYLRIDEILKRIQDENMYK